MSFAVTGMVLGFHIIFIEYATNAGQHKNINYNLKAIKDYHIA